MFRSPPDRSGKSPDVRATRAPLRPARWPWRNLSPAGRPAVSSAAIMRFPVGGALRHGDFAPACGEPFDLLQLHPIPRRIADHGVKPAGQPFAFPIRPHAGERHLPVQEAFFINQFSGLGKNFMNRSKISGRTSGLSSNRTLSSHLPAASMVLSCRSQLAPDRQTARQKTRATPCDRHSRRSSQSKA